MDSEAPMGGKSPGLPPLAMVDFVPAGDCPPASLLLGNLWLSRPWAAAGSLRKSNAAPALETRVGGASWSPWNGAAINAVELLQPVAAARGRQATARPDRLAPTHPGLASLAARAARSPLHRARYAAFRSASGTDFAHRPHSATPPANARAAGRDRHPATRRGPARSARAHSASHGFPAKTAHSTARSPPAGCT